MTNEDAIRILSILHLGHKSECKQACDKAIKAIQEADRLKQFNHNVTYRPNEDYEFTYYENYLGESVMCSVTILYAPENGAFEVLPIEELEEPMSYFEFTKWCHEWVKGHKDIRRKEYESCSDADY